jgi:hypothetical protein
MDQMKIVIHKILIIIGTNACFNGKFLCSNRFYEPKIISTSKVNDGICDCCDGSDEFNLGCPKTCLDLSNKEFDKLMDNYLSLKMVVTNYQEDTYLNYFNYNKDTIEKIITTYNDLKDLMDKQFLIKSYMNKVENSMTEENEDYIDNNGVIYKDLKRMVENLNDRIQLNMEFLDHNENVIKTYEIFSIIEDCLKVNYKYFECELCSSSFKCTGNKGSKYRNKFLG